MENQDKNFKNFSTREKRLTILFWKVLNGKIPFHYWNLNRPIEKKLISGSFHSKIEIFHTVMTASHHTLGKASFMSTLRRKFITARASLYVKYFAFLEESSEKGVWINLIIQSNFTWRHFSRKCLSVLITCEKMSYFWIIKAWN